MNICGVMILFYIMYFNIVNFCLVWYYVYLEEIKVLIDNCFCIVLWYIVLFVYLLKEKKGRILKCLYYENVSDV